MNRLFATALCGGFFLGHPVFAQEVTGGSLALSRSGFLGDTRIAKTAIDGQIELGFGRSFSLQGDLGFSNLDAADQTGVTATVHAIYHVTDQTSLGLFYGADRIGGNTVDFTGFEVGQETAAFDLEAYVAYGEESGVSGNVAGASGRYAVNDSLGVGASIQHGDLDGLGITRIGLQGDVAVAPRFSVSAEIGSVSGSAVGTSNSETFIGLGGRITFGADRGATFGKRGLLNLIPGS